MPDNKHPVLTLLRRRMLTWSTGFTALILCAFPRPALAWDQWASEVIDFSSQYSASGPWSASQIKGHPDVPDYGDDRNAWVPANQNGTQEHITVGFPDPVHAEGVTIRENAGNGFVTRIDVLDTSGTYIQVWSGNDPSQPGSVVDYKVTWTRTPFLVRGVKVYVDTSHSTDWEEIDAIQLHGVTPGDYQWASHVIGFSAEYTPSPGEFSAAQALGPSNVTRYGSSPNAWTPKAEDAGIEYLTLGFDRPVYSTGVGIIENRGNGYVTKIEALDTSGTYHTVWTGTDPSPVDTLTTFIATWPQTAYPVNGIKITIDTARRIDDWEEIDAVYIRGAGISAPVPVLTAVRPDTVFHEGPAFTLTVEGADFGRTSVVRWNGSARPTRFISLSRLEADIRASDIAEPTSVSITVHTPPPGGGTSNAVTLSVSTTFAQWATSVIAVSSQWGDPPGQYSSTRALGAPDVTKYGDDPNAWAPADKDVGVQTITLGFTRPVYANGALVRENSGNGFVTKLEVLDMSDAYHTVWSGTDPSQPGDLADFVASFDQTAYAVRGLRITINTNLKPNTWEEIDAVQLRGVPVSYPVPAITKLSPNPMLRGGPASMLAITGTGFSPASVVRWNGADRATTYVSPTALAIPVTAAETASNGTVSISVFTPEPGGGTSGTATLTIGPALYGDVDGSGTVDLADVRLALRSAAGTHKTVALNGGDVGPQFPESEGGYGDGRINVLDAIRIIRFLNGR